MHARDAVVVAILAVATQTVALHGTGYTLDDKTIVQDNPRLVVHTAADAWTLVSTPYWSERYSAERLWRPTTLASLALDRALLGPEPDRYRACGLAWHALTCVLLLLLLRRLVPGRRVTLFAALLFAVQPVHAEATAGIVGRGEVLALLLTLAGLHVHLSARRAAAAAALGEPGRGGLARVLLHALATALFALAAGAKEVALTAPFLALVLELAAGRRWPSATGGLGRTGAPAAEPQGRAPKGLSERCRAAAPSILRALARAWPYALYAAMLVGYFALRLEVLGDLLPGALAAKTEDLPLHVRLLVAAEVGRDALRAVLVPQPTSAHYPFVAPSWSDVRPIGAGALHLALLGMAIVQLRSAAPVRRALGFGVLAFYLSLGPVSNIVPIGVVRADRVLYTPSAFLDLALAAALALAPAPAGVDPRARRFALTAALALTLATCALQLGENALAWTSDDRIWQTTAERFPDDPKAQGALGELLVFRGAADEALPHLRRAVDASPPGHPLAAQLRADLGDALARLRRHDEARLLLVESLALDPTSEGVYLGLARLGLAEAEAAPSAMGRARGLREAERAARDGVSAVPWSYELWVTWGRLLAAQEGREPEALMAFDQALLRRPEPWQALLERARLRRGGLQDAVGALQDYRRAADILLALPAARAVPELERWLRECMIARLELSRRLGGRDEPAERWLAAAGLLERVERELDARR